MIGLELGQALHRLGVEVKVFGLGGQVGPLTDPEVMAYAEKAFQEEFYLDANVKVKSMVREDDKVQIDFINYAGEEERFTVDYVLAATGRRPNVDKLGLENTPIELDDKGVPVADPFTMQTSVGIFLLPVMPATKSHYCMRQQTRVASQVTMQVATQIFVPDYVAQPSQQCSVILSSLW
ncbi:dihydrolipoamide dehydrogenase [Vibrio ishigakensis]|uniref:Dihydrolipoamide dehydrogenase n=1 Tax=Vibrio ishigakensis TaxID=1481914 RepID=A0A0B8PBL5_9VIBR|nr:dihydrolipoamide dehydrogenase [Vibrio ishigakensis]